LDFENDVFQKCLVIQKLGSILHISDNRHIRHWRGFCYRYGLWLRTS